MPTLKGARLTRKATANKEQSRRKTLFPLPVLNKCWKLVRVAAFNPYCLGKIRKNVVDENYRPHLQVVTYDTPVKALNTCEKLQISSDR